MTPKSHLENSNGSRNQSSNQISSPAEGHRTRTKDEGRRTTDGGWRRRQEKRRRSTRTSPTTEGMEVGKVTKEITGRREGGTVVTREEINLPYVETHNDLSTYNLSTVRTTTLIHQNH